MIGIIYKATSPSNKSYIGKTTKSLNKRINEHLNKSKYEDYYFSRAIRKHGINNFKWEEIEIVEKETTAELEKKLKDREKYWIQKEKTNITGYNMTKGGDGTAGLKRIFSEEHRKKLSLSHKGKKLSDDHKRKISEAEKGRIFPDEVKIKLSLSKKGSNNPMFGRNFSDEHRKKLKESRKSRKLLIKN